MVENILVKISGFQAVNFVRYLLLAKLAALFISTSLAVGLEILLYLSFAVFPSLRTRLLRVASQPMVMMLIIWVVVLIIAGFYSVAPVTETIDNLTSWRKLLLLPMAAAVFDNNIWKMRLVWMFIFMVSIGGALSWLSWLGDIHFYKYPLGIIIHNHASQGILFAVALFVIVVVARYAMPMWIGGRLFLLGSGLLLLTNIMFVTPGRSGYLALLVLALVAVFALVKNNKKRFILFFTVPLLLGSLLFFSPVAQHRIIQGIEEIKNYQTSTQITSMGVRVVMWQNTLPMIKERPWFGYGTGAFKEAYQHQVTGQEGWRGQRVGDPHNQFLKIIAEQGIFGFLVFLLFIGAFFRQKVEEKYRILGLGVLVAWCATSMFSSHFVTFMEGRFLYIWCGALLIPLTINTVQAEDSFISSE